jgi:flagellar hook-associated protein 3 FlgL
MNITGVGSKSSLVVQSLVDLRQQLDDLQRQLGTGKKSDTYAGVGLDRGFAVGLRSHVSALSAYDNTITNVGVRMQLAQSTLGRIADIGHATKGNAFQEVDIQSDGTTNAQSTAKAELGEILGLLNTRSGDRYLFSGLAADQPAVESLDHIMNGDGARAGFNQVLTERKQADLGASGLGRLLLTQPTLTSVRVAEDAVSPFGFKLAAVNTNLTGATVTGPAGSPAAASIDLGAVNPNAGESVDFRFNLPDGTSESITLKATASATPGPNEFSIGATSDVTATNLKNALSTALGKLADTSLTAASAVAAGNDFFGNPPQRVSGAPATATSLTAGTSADTVFWYVGEDGPTPARDTATAGVDSSITVSYGLRANEQGIRWVVQNMASLAAVTYSPTDPNALARATALHQRVGNNLDVPPGTQRIEDIESQIAGAQSAAATAKDRHQQTSSTLSDLLQQIEGVPTDQVAAQVLALQTNLQASMQTTAMLYKTSLVNFI